MFRTSLSVLAFAALCFSSSRIFVGRPRFCAERARVSVDTELLPADTASGPRPGPSLRRIPPSYRRCRGPPAALPRLPLPLCYLCPKGQREPVHVYPPHSASDSNEGDRTCRTLGK